jgi:hypothetical protein
MEERTMTLDRYSFKRNYLGGMSTLVGFAALAAGAGVFASTAAAQSAAPPPAATAKKSRVHAVAGPQPGQQTFASAAEASEALVAALDSDDRQAMLKLLGPNGKDIVSSGDETADRNERAQIAEKYKQMHRLVMEPDGMTTLYVGAENWPTPIPLAHKGAVWYFDTAAGKQQILYRRVGRNELATIQVCREMVDAEKEYYSQPHDGSDKHYAEKIFSDPGKQNGLYWKTASGEPESPIGPLVAAAAAEGYAEPNDGTRPHPFEGYYFKTLKASAQAAGHTQSFAFVAYPAKYRDSGVMTFLVDQNGVVYEKDLGPKTEEVAKAMTGYHRDATWRKAD